MGAISEKKLKELCREVAARDLGPAASGEELRATALRALLIRLREELGIGPGDGVMAVPGALRAAPYDYALRILLNHRADFDFPQVIEQELLKSISQPSPQRRPDEKKGGGKGHKPGKR